MLPLLGTGEVKSRSRSGRNLKRNQPSLFRGKSPGFVNLLLCQHVAKLASPQYSYRFVVKSRGRHARRRALLREVTQ